MFQIQKQIIVRGFLNPLWKKVSIPEQVRWQLDKLSSRRNKINAVNTLASMEAQRTKIPHRVIEVK